MKILFKDKRKRKKNREHIKKREKVGNKREGRKIKEREKLSREKRVIRVINYYKWVPFTLAKIKSRN